MTQAGIFIVKMMKFGATGLSGLVIDFGITWYLKERMQVNKYVASSTGFILAASNNYLINRIWTFQSKKNWLPEFSKFIGFALMGLLLSNLFIMLLQKKKVPFYWAKGIAVICVFGFNFLANYFYNF